MKLLSQIFLKAKLIKLDRDCAGSASLASLMEITGDWICWTDRRITKMMDRDHEKQIHTTVALTSVCFFGGTILRHWRICCRCVLINIDILRGHYHVVEQLPNIGFAYHQLMRIAAKFSSEGNKSTVILCSFVKSSLVNAVL